MSDEIKVTVVRFPDRKALMLRYIDPITGKQKHKSAKTTIMRDAERAGAKWEAELREGRYCGSRITWADFRQRYEDEVLTSLAAGTDAKVQGVFNAVEKHINPQRLANLTADRLSVFQAKLRDAKLAESTIAPMLAHLRAALQWAVRMKMLAAVPSIEKPKRAKGGKIMKGRPITGEEFDRMLAKVEKIVGEKRKAAWTHYMRGLWLSGLRLGESLNLWWDRDDKLCVVLGGKYPMMRIPAALEKGNKDRLLPIAPEFAEFLLATPEAERTGPVFNPTTRHKIPRRPGEWWASRAIAKIGKSAGVKVNSEPVKYASAHDFRRSFGTRWASRVKPATLQLLMRHSAIETTLKYYVALDADEVACELWSSVSNSSGNTTPNGDVSKSKETQETAKISMVGGGVEPPTHGFSVRCSTN